MGTDFTPWACGAMTMLGRAGIFFRIEAGAGTAGFSVPAPLDGKNGGAATCLLGGRREGVFLLGDRMSSSSVGSVPAT